MFLIVGLGNPGEKYKYTRHNIGFRIIDEFAKKYNFPDFKFSKKFNAEISKNAIGGQKIILAKPQTFMNKSGVAVKKLILNLLDASWRTPRRVASKILNLFVVHDDVDLPLSEIRIVKNRGAAGHKGVESIIRELKTKDFVRFRIGIKSQKTENKKQRTDKFVLQKFNKDEEKIAEETIKKAVEAIETTLGESVEKAMNRYNN